MWKHWIFVVYNWGECLTFNMNVALSPYKSVEDIWEPSYLLVTTHLTLRTLLSIDIYTHKNTHTKTNKHTHTHSKQLPYTYTNTPAHTFTHIRCVGSHTGIIVTVMNQASRDQTISHGERDKSVNPTQWEPQSWGCSGGGGGGGRQCDGTNR